MGWLISKIDMIVQEIRAIPRRLWPIGTWANRPNAASFPFAFYFVTDIAGGALFRSNGTRWVPVSACLTLAEQNTPVSVGATTDETVLHSLSLPAGLIGPSDSIEVWVRGTISANTNNKRFQLRIGGTGIDGDVITVRAEATATGVTTTMILGFAMASSISAQIGFGSGATGASGTSQIVTAVDFAPGKVLYLTGTKVISASDTLTANIVSWRLIRGVA